MFFCNLVDLYGCQRIRKMYCSVWSSKPRIQIGSVKYIAKYHYPGIGGWGGGMGFD